jgi:hypothetical protein
MQSHLENNRPIQLLEAAAFLLGRSLYSCFLKGFVKWARIAVMFLILSEAFRDYFGYSNPI